MRSQRGSSRPDVPLQLVSHYIVLVSQNVASMDNHKEDRSSYGVVTSTLPARDTHTRYQRPVDRLNIDNIVSRLRDPGKR